MPHRTERRGNGKGRAAWVVTIAVAAMFAAAPGRAETFHWAGKTDPSTMDPHATNIAPVLGFLNNIYEGLVRRGKDMSLEPALAESWEALGGDGWRFHLRRGVVFHQGQSFDADDVVFSYERAGSEQSDVRSFFASVSDILKVDQYTVDFLTGAPDPLFPDGIANAPVTINALVQAFSEDTLESLADALEDMDRLL